MVKMWGVKTSIIVGVILLFVVSGCGITGYTVVKVDEMRESTAEQQDNQQNTKTLDIEPLNNNPVKSKSKVLADNVQQQIETSQTNERPRVRITNPDPGDIFSSSPVELAWQASDPNGDTLLVHIEYEKSGDGWRTIVENYPNGGKTTIYHWDMNALTEGNYRLKVTVSDGKELSSDVEDFKIQR